MQQATWTDLEIIILSEVSQTEKDKYHMTSLICRILKKKQKNQMNLSPKQKESYTHRIQTYGYQSGKGEEGRNTLGRWD